MCYMSSPPGSAKRSLSDLVQGRNIHEFFCNIFPNTSKTLHCHCTPSLVVKCIETVVFFLCFLGPADVALPEEEGAGEQKTLSS